MSFPESLSSTPTGARIQPVFGMAGILDAPFRGMTSKSDAVVLRFKPKAGRMLRLVSIRQRFPFSMLSMVIGETAAFLASSGLPLKKDSPSPF